MGKQGEDTALISPVGGCSDKGDAIPGEARPTSVLLPERWHCRKLFQQVFSRKPLEVGEGA